MRSRLGRRARAETGSRRGPGGEAAASLSQAYDATALLVRRYARVVRRLVARGSCERRSVGRLWGRAHCWPFGDRAGARRCGAGSMLSSPSWVGAAATADLCNDRPVSLTWVRDLLVRGVDLPALGLVRVVNLERGSPKTAQVRAVHVCRRWRNGRPCDGVGWGCWWMLRSSWLLVIRRSRSRCAAHRRTRSSRSRLRWSRSLVLPERIPTRGCQRTGDACRGYDAVRVPGAVVDVFEGAASGVGTKASRSRSYQGRLIRS